MDRIKELRQRKADLATEAEALLVKSATEEALTDAEDARYEAIEVEQVATNKSISREERLMEERRTMEAVVDLSADTEDEAGDKLPAAAKKDVEKFGSFEIGRAACGERG